MRSQHSLSESNLLQTLQGFPIRLLKIYGRSFSVLNGLTYGLIRTPEGKNLAVVGEKQAILSDPFRGTVVGGASALKICDLCQENTECLMTLFPFTKPVPLLKRWVTVGTGDRLGVATPGHLRAVERFPVRPVLAQQSVRENIQTGRDFSIMIRDAAWGVFQENYQKGYGADGDHLKSLQEVKNALEAGVSMVTLDLSEKLNPEAFRGSKEDLDRRFREEVAQDEADVLSHLFLDKEFYLKNPQGECLIHFDEADLKRNALLFHKAVDFTEEAYEFIRDQKGSLASIDFEISIDETPFPTSPQNHLFFVVAIAQRGIQIDSLAPRFVGEFQKAIDYRGDLKAFHEDYLHHSLIAHHHGKYKISIHSGSDKFSAFRVIGGISKDGFHLKTAGTSWLEAVRLIARKSPSLYREMHQYALKVFEDAAKLYHVTTDLNRIPKLETLRDGDLPALMDHEDARQLLHITYGYLLNAKEQNEEPLFRDRFFATLTEYEEDYWTLLEAHIGRHLTSLGLNPNLSG